MFDKEKLHAHLEHPAVAAVVDAALKHETATTDSEKNDAINAIMLHISALQGLEIWSDGVDREAVENLAMMIAGSMSGY